MEKWSFSLLFYNVRTLNNNHNVVSIIRLSITLSVLFGISVRINHAYHFNCNNCIIFYSVNMHIGHC